jgi:hypothetical protein
MDLMRWARKELPEGKENEQTLEWMLREGEGEKLENIAAEANVPAPRVRQRVSRLRRYVKARWAAQTAAVAALLLVSIAIFLALRGKKEEIAPRPDPSFEPSSLPLPPPSAPLLPAPLIPAGSTDTPDAVAPSATATPSAAPVTPSPKAIPTDTFPTKPTPAPQKTAPNRKKGGGGSLGSSGDSTDSPFQSTVPPPAPVGSGNAIPSQNLQNSQSGPTSPK